MSKEQLNEVYKQLAAELGDTIYKISLLELHVDKLKASISEINSVAAKLAQKPAQPEASISPITQTKPVNGKKT